MLSVELVTMSAPEFWAWLALAALVGAGLLGAGMLVAREVAWRRLNARINREWLADARRNRVAGRSDETLDLRGRH